MQPCVYIIDDDQSVRDALEDLLQSIDLKVKTFASTRAFLADIHPEIFGCILLDIRMPEQSGLSFQSQMQSLGIHLPVIFITGHGDVAMSVQAMKNGAIDFLQKPFHHQELIDAIQKAIQQDTQRIEATAKRQHVYELWTSLNRGEQEVIKLVLKDYLNKQIAAELNLSEITIKVRRANAMKKLQVNSLLELVHLLGDYLKTQN